MDSRRSTDRLRRGAGLLALCCFFVLLGLGARYVTHLPRFNIERIDIIGDTSFTDVDSLRKSLWERLDGNYFFADLDPLREAAGEMPWVASAKVERVWPDVIRVEIARRRAIATWNGDRLISDRAEVFSAKGTGAPELTQSLPAFSGPDTMAAEAVSMYARLSPIAKGMGTEILSLGVTDRGSWSVVIQGESVPKTRVELGRTTRDSSIQSRFGLVAAHYGEVERMMGGSPASIDARYVNAFAATMPRPGSAVAPASAPAAQSPRDGAANAAPDAKKRAPSAQRVKKGPPV